MGFRVCGAGFGVQGFGFRVLVAQTGVIEFELQALGVFGVQGVLGVLWV